LLAVELLWIVIGIVYIIYKLQNEDHIFSKETIIPLLLIFSFIVIPQLIVEVLCDEDNIEFAKSIATLITCLPFLGVLIYGINFTLSSKHNKSNDLSKSVGKSHSEKRTELIDEFEQHGYHIADDLISRLLSDPLSPINHGNHKEISLFECYNWLCKERTWEIEKLKGDELSTELGVPLEVIPVRKDLPIGEAYLCRSLLAKNYILMKDGLKYRAYSDTLQMRYSSSYLNKENEYYKTFNNFVDNYISEHH